MTVPLRMFDAEWFEHVRCCHDQDSWTEELQQNIYNDYLATLETWFGNFPLPDNQKTQLLQRLTSLNTAEHLGAVNELTWWSFMKQADRSIAPLPASSTPTPDFHLGSPYDCYFEVTTLNQSAEEVQKQALGNSISLDHGKTTERVIKKFTREKLAQLKFGESNNAASVMVIFDYTAWSGLGANFASGLAFDLFCHNSYFKIVGPALSALVIMNRGVKDDRIFIDTDRSIVIHNPVASRPVSRDAIPPLKQYWVESTNPIRSTSLMYLSSQDL